jgi:hypothetical protein
MLKLNTHGECIIVTIRRRYEGTFTLSAAEAVELAGSLRDHATAPSDIQRAVLVSDDDDRHPIALTSPKMWLMPQPSRKGHVPDLGLQQSDVMGLHQP